MVMDPIAGWWHGLAMGIFDRMGKVISSNFNALLDSADDPSKSFELTLSDMRAQVRAARQEVVQSVAAEKQLRRKVEELDAEIVKWERRAELAIKHSDDGLAREALVQKKRLTGERDRAEALRAEQRGNAVEMKAELERMEAKFEEVNAKKSQFVAKAAQARAASQGQASLKGGVGGGAFEEFRRMEDQLEAVDATVAAQREVEAALAPGLGPAGMTRDEVEAKFRAMERGGSSSGSAAASEVDEELAQLKKRVRVDS